MYLKPYKPWLKIFSKQIALLLFLLLCSVSVLATQNDLSEPLSLLSERSFDTKASAIDQIAESNNPQTKRIFTSLLEGELHYRKSDNRIFYLSDLDDGYLAEDVITGEKIEEKKKRAYKKVTINNSLRIKLRQAIAEVHGLDPERIIAGNGSDELLQLLGYAFLQDGDEVTFGTPERRLWGREIGYSEALRFDLRDGFPAWDNAGMPVE